MTKPEDTRRLEKPFVSEVDKRTLRQILAQTLEQKALDGGFSFTIQDVEGKHPYLRVR
ncbi:MAG: hypothetical protein M3Y72_09490 [Acidobacteriota bacterium]|nr:hypothetical protein [Acidobacteriota bacterium]